MCVYFLSGVVLSISIEAQKIAISLEQNALPQALGYMKVVSMEEACTVTHQYNAMVGVQDTQSQYIWLRL